MLNCKIIRNTIGGMFFLDSPAVMNLKFSFKEINIKTWVITEIVYFKE